MFHESICSCFSNFVLVHQVVVILMGITITFAALETDVTVALHASDSRLPVCGDSMPTLDHGQVAIFWKVDKNSSCSYVKASGKSEQLETGSILPSDGFMLLLLNQTEKNSVTVTCRKDSQVQRGVVQFKLDENFSSSECVSADWLKKTGPNYLTICMEPLEHFTKLSWNASTPLEKCSFINESADSNSSTAIHVLPHSVSINLDDSSRHARFFIKCKYPPTDEIYTAGPVSYSSEKICSMKEMDIQHEITDGSDPRIAPIHQAFVSRHVGLFVTFIVATLVVIGILTLFAVKRFRRQQWRQGQRLLVNEESDDAALREYQEMAT